MAQEEQPSITITIAIAVAISTSSLSIHDSHMANTYFEAIVQLQTSTSITAQIAAAKHIKNGLIGHPENKEAFVRYGLVDALAKVLAGDENGRSKSTVDIPSESSVAFSEEIDTKYQAILLLGGLVNGWNSHLYKKDDLLILW